MACRHLLPKMNLGFAGFGVHSARSCNASYTCLQELKLGIAGVRGYSARSLDASDACVRKLRIGITGFGGYSASSWDGSDRLKLGIAGIRGYSARSFDASDTVRKLRIGITGFGGYSASSWDGSDRLKLGIAGIRGYSARSFDAPDTVRKMRSTGFRGYSTRSWDAPDICLIRGASQDIAFPGWMLESLADHEAAFPLVTKIPDEKLIILEKARPYEISDHWRQIFYSGFMHSYLCKTHQDCIVNPFEYSNIGVIKGLNILGFKKFDRIVGKVNSDHCEYTNFVEDTFSRFCGPSPLLVQFPECQDFLEACINGDESDDEVLRHHSFFLEAELLADLYNDIHMALRHQFRHRRLGSEARKILTTLNESFSNGVVVRYCMRHMLLRFLLGSHCPIKMKKQFLQGVMSRPPPDGTAIVDVHRNAVQHAIEEDLLDAALRMYPQYKDLLNTYSRVDLINALRYMFPTYPGKALSAFKEAGVLHHLGLHRRFPIDNLYKYVTPDKKEGHQGGAIMTDVCMTDAIMTDVCMDEWLESMSLAQRRQSVARIVDLLRSFS